MKSITYLALLLLLAAPVPAQITRDQLPPEKASQISDAQLELTNWMMFYYKKPLPDDFPRWLKSASTEGMLKDEKRQFSFLGFAATVFAANSGKVPQWMGTIDALPKQDRKVSYSNSVVKLKNLNFKKIKHSNINKIFFEQINLPRNLNRIHRKTVLIALWLSGTKASRDAISVKPRKTLLRGRNYFNFQTRREPPSLDGINVCYGGFPDIQWGRFFASGSEKPIKNVISVLELAQFIGSRQKYTKPKGEKEKQAVLKEAIFRSAIWSLRSNCQMHPEVLTICEQIYKKGKLSRLARLSLKSILIELKPDKYKIDGTSNN